MSDPVGFEDGGVGFGDFGAVKAFDVVVRKELDDVVSVGVGIEGADSIFKFFDTDAVDPVHEGFAAGSQIGVDGVGEDGGQNDRLRANGFGFFSATIIKFVVEIGIGRFGPGAAKGP